MTDIIGIELPIAVSMGELRFVYQLGRVSSGAILEDQMSLLILVIVLLLFAKYCLQFGVKMILVEESPHH